MDSLTEDIAWMLDFVLKNCTRFAPPYACIFINEVETVFFKSQYLQLFLWLHYIDNMFYMSKIYPILTIKICSFLDIKIEEKSNGTFFYRHIFQITAYTYLQGDSYHPSHVTSSLLTKRHKSSNI